MRWLVIAGVSVVGAVVAAVVGYALWLSFPQRAEESNLQKARGIEGVALRESARAVVLMPDSPKAGLLVYPGARVEPAAYAFKMSGIAQKGMAVVIAKPLFNFALLDITNPDEYKKEAAGVNDWYVAGHSLGGVKACAVAGAEPQKYRGLVLFGAYCSSSIKDIRLKVLSIGGGNDGLTTGEDIETHASLLPSNTIFKMVEGMNHAGFGDYGLQDGDAEMTAADDYVRAEIASAVTALIGLE